MPLIRRDGARYELELRGVPIQHRGQPHVLYIGRDITERKRAEDALRASEARHRLLFETESDALVLVDLDTLRLVDVNPAAMQMYGRSRDELLQMTAPDLSAEPDATRRAIQEGEGAHQHSGATAPASRRQCLSGRNSRQSTAARRQDDRGRGDPRHQRTA